MRSTIWYYVDCISEQKDAGRPHIRAALKMFVVQELYSDPGSCVRPSRWAQILPSIRGVGPYLLIRLDSGRNSSPRNDLGRNEFPVQGDCHLLFRYGWTGWHSWSLDGNAAFCSDNLAMALRRCPNRFLTHPLSTPYFYSMLYPHARHLYLLTLYFFIGPFRCVTLAPLLQKSYTSTTHMRTPQY